MENKKMSPTAHNAPEFKSLRKMFQGINSTTKGSVEKSIRRHGAKSKAISKMKN